MRAGVWAGESVRERTEEEVGGDEKEGDALETSKREMDVTENIQSERKDKE